MIFDWLFGSGRREQNERILAGLRKPMWVIPEWEAEKALRSENAVLRDLLKSACRGFQVVSMDGKHIARLVDGELVIEQFREGDADGR